jgi:photosystem II stability/assembly factor-like uncharacterized protein
MKLSFPILILCAIQFSQTRAQDLTQDMVRAVSADSMIKTITALQHFGTRYEYTSGQDSAGAFLLREFSRMGLQTSSDWYSFGNTTLYDAAVTDAGTLLIAGSNGIILTSTDTGDHWNKPASPVTNTLYGIACANGQIACAVGSSGCILRTTDGGNTWNPVSSGLAINFLDIGFINDTLGILVGASGKILRTTDAGSHWSSSTSGSSVYLRSLKIVNASNIWAAGDGGTLLHSTDAGLTWSPVSTNSTMTIYSVEFSTSLQGWIVGTGPTILRTTDGGTGWTRVTVPPTAQHTLRGVSFQDSLHGWIVEYYGKVFSTTDGGTTWTKNYDHYSDDWGPFFVGVKVMDGQLLSFGNQAVLVSSNDSGLTWTALTPNLPSSMLHTSRNIVATLPGVSAPEEECILVAHYDSYSTVDPNTAAPGANDNASGTSAILEAARIAAGYRFRSTIRFVAVSGEELGMFGSKQYAREAFARRANIIGAVNGDMIGYPTTADTARLVIATYLTPNPLLDSALAANQRYGLGITLVSELDNTGASDYGPFAIRGYNALDIAEGTPGEIWGGNDPYYHSPSDIVSNIHPGLVHRGAQLMLAVAANLAVPQSRTTSIETDKPELPRGFALEQNWPNPFNPRTVVSSQYSAVSDVRIVIYDLLGREVATLVNERRAPGRYQDTFDASGLASGVYIYRLTAGSFTQSRTMLLLK